jgi:hypothetical protein
MGFNALCFNTTAPATATSGSICLCDENITRIGIHFEHGALTGTWTVKASTDPRARAGHPDYTSAEWDDVTATFALTDPAGGAADFSEVYENSNWDFLLITYTHAAGAVKLWMRVSCR